MFKEEKKASREQWKYWGGCVRESEHARRFTQELTMETDKDLGKKGARESGAWQSGEA